jgi:cytoskeletal protein RodZ
VRGHIRRTLTRFSSEWVCNIRVDIPAGFALFCAATGNKNMKILAEYLQNERQARGKSLEQISNDTRISMNMLRAIEEGNVERLPAPVLVKGFLRAYAKEIGLDPEAVIARYQDLVEEEDARQEALERFHLRMRPEHSRRRGIVLLSSLVLLTTLVFLVLWFKRSPNQPLSPVPSKQTSGSEAVQTTAQQASESDLPQEPSATVIQQSVEPLQTEASTEPDTPALEAQLSQPNTSSAEGSPTLEQRASSLLPTAGLVVDVSSAAAPYVLRAEILETTWLHMIIDDGQELEYLLHPAEEITWRAVSGFRLLVGNAAGLRLYLNDQPLKPLGESGEVVRLQLPDSSLIVISDSETPNQ